MKESKTESTVRAPEQLASEFLFCLTASGEYRRDLVAGLAQCATSTDQAVAGLAARAIFTSVVEKLADSFDPRAVGAYNRLFAQLIEHCRKTERGRAIDRELHDLGVRGEDDLVARAERLRNVQRLGEKTNVDRVIMLSRVTIGADVAITSVIIERLKREFPAAEITLVGGGKVAELFGGDQRLRFCEISYQRSSTLIERLLSWIDLLGRVRALANEPDVNQCLIVDPDSRLTQLGLLPLATTTGDYVFFPSREYASDTDLSLGELTSRWASDIFGASETILPRLALADSDLRVAAETTRQLRQGNQSPLVAINFGVGENPLKRVGEDFEKQLVASLIQGGAKVILDKGAGESEARRAEAIINYAVSFGLVRVAEADGSDLKDSLARDRLSETSLFALRGSVGLLAAMIGQSDLYIGYDSAGQHIAAALGVPCLDVFAGFSSARMLRRWRPTGPSEVRVISVDTLNAEADQRAVLDETLGHVRSLCP
jgi:ADP-heptose:LPS heptosyltransferase